MSDLDKLAAALRLRAPELKQIWTAVQDNQRKLDACPGPHDFQELPSERPISKEFVCSLCNGKIQASEHRWYALGLKHGRAKNS